MSTPEQFSQDPKPNYNIRGNTDAIKYIGKKFLNTLNPEMIEGLNFEIIVTNKGFNNENEESANLLLASYSRSRDVITLVINLKHIERWVSSFASENEKTLLKSNFKNEVEFMEMSYNLEQLLMKIVQNAEIPSDYLKIIDISVFHELMHIELYEKYSDLVTHYKVCESAEFLESFTKIVDQMKRKPTGIQLSVAIDLYNKSHYLSRRNFIQKLLINQLEFKFDVSRYLKPYWESYLIRIISMGYMELMIKVLEIQYQIDTNWSEIDNIYTIDIGEYSQHDSLVLLPEFPIFQEVQRYINDRDFNGALEFLEEEMREVLYKW